jgi:hypothetical protein
LKQKRSKRGNWKETTFNSYERKSVISRFQWKNTVTSWIAAMMWWVAFLMIDLGPKNVPLIIKNVFVSLYKMFCHVWTSCKRSKINGPGRRPATPPSMVSPPRHPSPGSIPIHTYIETYIHAYTYQPR